MLSICTKLFNSRKRWISPLLQGTLELSKRSCDRFGVFVMGNVNDDVLLSQMADPRVLAFA
jgi:hypothetical protein